MTFPLQANSPMTSIDTKIMEAELKELRHHLDRKVEQKTAQLVRRITLLESCNATLCDKLELIQRECAALKQQAAAQAIWPAHATQPMPIKPATHAATGRVAPVLLN